MTPAQRDILKAVVAENVSLINELIAADGILTRVSQSYNPDARRILAIELLDTYHVVRRPAPVVILDPTEPEQPAPPVENSFARIAREIIEANPLGVRNLDPEPPAPTPADECAYVPEETTADNA